MSHNTDTSRGGREGVGGRVFTMENKDTNTDYQKVVRVGDQK